MRNKYAAILANFEEQKNRAVGKKTWAPGVNVVAGLSKSGSRLLWIRAEWARAALTPTDFELLASNNLLEHEGKTVRRKFGGSTVSCFVVKEAELSLMARDAHRSNSKVALLEQEVANLSKQLKEAYAQSASDQAMAELIHEIRQKFPVAFEKRLESAFSSNVRRSDSFGGIPTLMLSDIHFSEVVVPAQVQYLNQYDEETAFRRLDRVFDQTMAQLFKHQAGYDYDAFCLILGGDILSGNILNELRMTNQQSVTDSILTLAPKLADKIVEIADSFPAVYVPAVVGNHGRLDKKPTAKNAPRDNFDYLLYVMVKLLVESRMGDRCNVEFDISDSLDLSFKLYNTRYLLTHGDQIAGDGGVGGFWPSLMKTTYKKQQRHVNSGLESFDYLVCGHFHRYGAVSNVIVNGSLKGYDEWAFKQNFDYEPPIQALWTTHPQYGIISRIPVYADEPIQDDSSNVPPVTPSSGMRRKARYA